MAGLVYRSQELRLVNGSPARARLWFHVPGGPYGRLKVKGVDPLMPAKRGRWPGNRLADQRVVPLHGEVMADDEEEYHELRATLDAIFDPELGAGTLTLGTDYPGIVIPRYIVVRFENYMATENIDTLECELDVELVTVADPDWHEVPGS
jgi:hypothetical protein